MALTFQAVGLGWPSRLHGNMPVLLPISAELPGAPFSHRISGRGRAALRARKNQKKSRASMFRSK